MLSALDSDRRFESFRISGGGGGGKPKSRCPVRDSRTVQFWPYRPICFA